MTGPHASAGAPGTGSERAPEPTAPTTGRDAQPTTEPTTKPTTRPTTAPESGARPTAHAGSGATPAAAGWAGIATSGDAKRAETAGGGRPAAYDDHHHADLSGGWLRPAVFGAMDGLVTNIALISGVGGGGASRHTIVLTGIAGLVAGAISMGLGEYTSVRTQNDQVAREVAKERRELERYPLAEAEELAQRWIDRGLPADLARQVAAAVGENPEEALRVHAQEELGVNPHQVPSPWVAAISSFFCFSIGAVLPLLPYLLGFNNLWPALIVGGCGLFLAGALTARFTNQRWWLSGVRQLLLGAAAAAATYGIGHLVGVSGVG